MPDAPDALPTDRKVLRSMARTRQNAFLAALQETGQIKAALKQAGIDRLATPFEWANTNPVFAKKFEAAREQGEKALLARYEQSLDAVVLSAESIDDFAKVQNSRFFRMKRLDPRYRDNAQTNIITGPIQINFSSNGPTVLPIDGDAS